MATHSAEEYEMRADDCERLAANATNGEVRQTLLYLARRWRDFAVVASKREQSVRSDGLGSRWHGRSVPVGSSAVDTPGGAGDAPAEREGDAAVQMSARRLSVARSVM